MTARERGHDPPEAEVVLVDGPDNVKPGTVDVLTKLLDELVRGGAALGWTAPPTADEVSELLKALAAGSAEGDAALALARVNGELAGVGYWRRYERPTHQPQADIEKVAVSPAAHRRGIGRALIQTLVEAASNACVEQLTADLRADNHASLALCTSLGFREYGRLPDFVAVGEDRYDKIMVVRDLR